MTLDDELLLLQGMGFVETDLETAAFCVLAGWSGHLKGREGREGEKGE
jgi:hypothetical protein